MIGKWKHRDKIALKFTDIYFYFDAQVGGKICGFDEKGSPVTSMAHACLNLSELERLETSKKGHGKGHFIIYYRPDSTYGAYITLNGTRKKLDFHSLEEFKDELLQLDNPSPETSEAPAQDDEDTVKLDVCALGVHDPCDQDAAMQNPDKGYKHYTYCKICGEWLKEVKW